MTAAVLRDGRPAAAGAAVLPWRCPHHRCTPCGRLRRELWRVHDQSRACADGSVRGARVSSATISGLHTFSNMTDHWESVDWDSGGPSWEIPEYYSPHSPLSYVADIPAPLLILHGEVDYRCSVTEADQLFGAMRKLKRTVE